MRSNVLPSVCCILEIQIIFQRGLCLSRAAIPIAIANRNLLHTTADIIFRLESAPVTRLFYEPLTSHTDKPTCFTVISTIGRRWPFMNKKYMHLFVSKKYYKL